MNETKPIWTTRTFWAAFFGFLAMLAEQFGLDFDPEGATEAVLKIVEGVCFILAIVFRFVAKRRATLL